VRAKKVTNNEPMPLKIMILGADGFIGSALTDAILTAPSLTT